MIELSEMEASKIMCTQIKFHLVSQQAKELLLTNKLCVSFNWT